MQNSAESSQPNPDDRTHGMEDTATKTIEYLRVRLLTERSVSKSEKERGDELSKRVKELEDQLKVVSLQRRRAEKATLDVLSYLESHGVSDVSEVYESESDQEDSYGDSNVVKTKNLASLESEGNDKESSGSDNESTPSSAGSLSWKGRKKNTQLLERNYLNSSTRRQAASPLVNSSPRHRLGKSCRQVRKREMRSAVDEPIPDNRKYDVQDRNALGCLDNGANQLDNESDDLKKSYGKQVEKGFRRVELPLSIQDNVQDGDASSSNCRPECNGEMERALEHQAHHIEFTEAQEKAQRDWEQKYEVNNVSMLELCEPGNHSDITDERDENEAEAPSSFKVAGCHGQKVGTDSNIYSKQPSITHFDSFKLSPHAAIGRSDKHNLSEVQPCRSPASDFAFPTMSSTPGQGHADGQLLRTVLIPGLGGQPTVPEPDSAHLSGQREDIPYEEPYETMQVLTALQEAKLLIKQRMNSLPETGGSVGTAFETSVCTVRDMDWLKIPVASPGLFRVPIEVQSQAPRERSSLVSNSSREFMGSYYNGSSPYYGDPYISSPMNSQLSTVGADTFTSNPVYQTSHGISSTPRVDFPFRGDATSSSKPVFPQYASLSNPPCTSSNQMVVSQIPRREVGVPPVGNSLFNHHFTSNMYS